MFPTMRNLRSHGARLAACLILGASAFAQNLVTNANFEAGNTGFSSDYGFSAAGNCCEGEYAVRSAPNTFNQFFVNPPPSSPGSSLMLVVNGATVPNQRVWYTTVTVTAGLTYRLQLAGCTAVYGGPAVLQWQVAGQLIGTPLPLPTVTQTWQVSGATWVAPTSGTVEIAIRNLNTSSFPNDFYIDDIFVGPCQSCWSHYGSGFPGALGIPNLVPSGLPSIGSTIQLEMTSVRATPEFGVLVLGIAAANTPTPFGGSLLVAPLATAAQFVPANPGVSTYSLAVPNNPGLIGLGIFAQFGHMDSTAAAGIAFSRGLQLVVGH
jgi:hypothetical protein